MDISQRRPPIENPTSLVYDRKFDTAIRDTFLVNYFYKVNKINSKRKIYDKYILQDIYSDINELHYSTEPHHYALFLKSILQIQQLQEVQKYEKILKKIRPIIDKSIEIQISYCLQNNYIYNKQNILAKFHQWTHEVEIPSTVYNLLYIANELDKIITLSQLMFKPKYQKLSEEKYHAEIKKLNKYTISSINTIFWWSETLFCISINNMLFYQPRSVMLMYHNKICDLISVLLYAKFSETNCNPLNAFSLTIRVIMEMINLMIKYKNNAFHIFKSLESLVIGESLARIEEWSNFDFLDNLSNDLMDKVKFWYPGSNLQRVLTDCDVPFMHNLGCLSKILGHPLVSIEQGTKDLHKKTTEISEISISKVLECICFFKRDYIKKHIQLYKRWPPCDMLPKTACKSLVYAQIYNKDPDSLWIRRRFGDTPIIAYENINLKKNIEFNNLENVIPYLKDKVVSLMRTEIIQKYFENITPEREWEKTRLLVLYLIEPNMVNKHIKYLRMYSQCHDMNKLADYLLIRIVPKEKELKISYRGFGCKTYEDRYRCIVQEKNVSLFLELYNEEQVLTDSELQIIKKLDAFRRITDAYHGHFVIYIVIDASAWNNRFSYKTVDDFCLETLDPIFDTNIFSKTHQAYEKTFCYICDGNNMYYWNGQRGGIEGQNQYTWMTVYINQIKVALKDFPFRYHMICKGDDMRIAVLVPQTHYDKKELGNLKRIIVDQISSTCKEFGHQINVEESYGSCHYFAFSKAASIDKIELPQTFRKIQKTYGANNAFINTLDDYISATLSNAHSACKVSPNIVPCYATGLFWLFFYLKNHWIYSSCTDNELISISLIPSIMGGFPIIYLHNFFVRAESDLLSPFIGLLTHCKTYYCEIYNIMCNFLYIRPPPPESYRILYTDPYSIPTSRPQLPGVALKALMIPQLKRISKNQDILELIKLSESKIQEDFIRLLDSCNIIRAKSLSLLYACSPEALLNEQLQKFKSGKSILDFLLIKQSRYKVHKHLRLIQILEHRLQKWRYIRLKGKNIFGDVSVEFLINECPSKSAYNIREFAFGKKVEDITMPPMQHQMFIKYVYNTPYNTWDAHNHFLYTIKIEGNNITYDDRQHYYNGPFEPFLGYTTTLGTIAPGFRFVEKDPTLNKIKTLIDLCSWMNVSEVTEDGLFLTSNAVLVVTQLLKLYTDIPLKNLSPFASIKKSGTVQHHMRSPHFRESIVPNTVSNIYTFIKGESSCHITLHNSSMHYKVNFLHCYCYVLWILTMELDFSKEFSVPDKVWGVTTPCPYCNKPIKEIPLIFDSALISNIEFTELRLAKINIVAETILQKSFEQSLDLTPNVRETGIEIDYETSCIGVLYYILIKQMTEKQSLANKYSHHAFSEKGFHVMSVLSGSSTVKDIGLTEIKNIHIDYIVHELLFLILHILVMDLDTYDESYIQYWTMNTPAETIPWYTLMSWFNNAGKLSELIAKIEIISGLPSKASYYNVTSAARYLTLAALQTKHLFFPKFKLICLTNFKETNVSIVIKSKLFNYRNYMIDKLLKTYHLHDIKGNLYSEQKQRLTYPAIIGLIIYYTFDLSETQILELLEYMMEKQISKFDIFDPNNVEEEVVLNRLEEYLIDETSHWTLNRLYNILQKIWEDKKLTEIIDLIKINFSGTLKYLREQTDIKKIEIEIVYTSIVECIRTVRSKPSEYQVTDYGKDIIVGAEDLESVQSISDERFYNLRYTSLLAVFKSYEHLESEQCGYKTNPTNLDLYSNRSYINTENSYRIYGQNNCSAQVLMYILCSINFSELSNKYLSICCLHDGLGGFTGVFDQLTCNSNIYFHTTPAENIFYPVPDFAIKHISGNNNVYYEYLSQGFLHIKDEYTISHLISTIGNAHIITSDLEYPHPFDNEYIDIQINVLRLINKLSMFNSLIIIKFDLRNVNIACIILHIIRLMFLNCFTCMPHGESCVAGHYLVAWNKSHVLIEDNDIIIKMRQENLYSDTTLKISKYIRFVNKKFEHEWLNTFRNSLIIPILNDRYYASSYKFCKKFGLYGVCKCIRGLGLNVKHIDNDARNFYNKLRECTDNESVAKVFEFYGVNNIYILKLIEKDLKCISLPQTSKKIDMWDLDTQIHRRILLQNLYRHYGFYISLKSLKSISTQPNLDLTTVWDFFINQIKLIDKRDLNDFNTILLGQKILPDVFPQTLIKCFIDGIHIFITLISCIYSFKDI